MLSIPCSIFKKNHKITPSDKAPWEYANMAFWNFIPFCWRGINFIKTLIIPTQVVLNHYWFSWKNLIVHGLSHLVCTKGMFIFRFKMKSMRKYSRYSNRFGMIQACTLPRPCICQLALDLPIRSVTLRARKSTRNLCSQNLWVKEMTVL